MLNSTPTGIRRLGKPKKIWLGVVEEYIKILEINNWYNVTQDRKKIEENSWGSKDTPIGPYINTLSNLKRIGMFENLKMFIRTQDTLQN